MKDSDYPNYFIAGDSASKKAQKWYVRLIGVDLVLMITSAALSVYNYQSEESKTIVYVISGFILLIALLISIFLRVRKYEDYWYSGRALAESCKTLTWRYIMLSEDFDHSVSAQEAEKRFKNKIVSVKDQFRDLNNVINTKYINLPFITNEMNSVRAFPLDKRVKYYLENRIQNQIDWYSSNAQKSKSHYEGWFTFVIVLQFFALISIAFLIKYPLSNYNLVGLFSTISASGLSWLQLKKYQENKEAYTMANAELNIIKDEARHLKTDDEFSKYVLDSENAMSREHTMWLAQKRI